jgi:hypothetical protein
MRLPALPRVIGFHRCRAGAERLAWVDVSREDAVLPLVLAYRAFLLLRPWLQRLVRWKS